MVVGLLSTEVLLTELVLVVVAQLDSVQASQQLGKALTQADPSVPCL